MEVFGVRLSKGTDGVWRICVNCLYFQNIASRNVVHHYVILYAYWHEKTEAVRTMAAKVSEDAVS